ncbi:MAG: DUF1287 domain-containing protein [Ahniella sp.]|nr:DUF1287 domain-containing protein [Ahniella sp.]
MITMSRYCRLITSLLLAMTSIAASATTPEQLVRDAAKQIGVTLTYDPSYRRLDYPNGDAPRNTGVCTDVVIRAYRDAYGFDLQRAVHEDMRKHFSRYPKNWGLRGPDRNIDHRRVPNLMRFLQRQGASLTVSKDAADYQTGDIVTWNLGGGITHIGLVDSGFVPGTKRPLVIHNIGAGTVREDILFRYTVTGHYRWSPAVSPATDQDSRGLPAPRDAAAQR